VHSQRVENPEQWRKCSVMTKRWRYVNGKELFDMQADPGQAKNVADQFPEVAKKMRGEYEQWWASLKPGFSQYVRIGLGADAENPANLTCHDWHTNNGPVPWNHGHIRKGPNNNGYWAVQVEQDGRYEFTLRRWPKQENKSAEATKARLKIGDVDATKPATADDTSVSFQVDLKKGTARMETWFTRPDGKTRGAYYVEVKRLK
ncbi:MAG: N-acetylgalactosamine 6-sulfate sulfatase, partial [Planctomycetales bacterium]